MLIDCDSCQARGPACGDCVIGAVLAISPATTTGPVDLDEDQRTALEVLAGSGLVPPLRLVMGAPGTGTVCDPTPTARRCDEVHLPTG